MPVLKNGNTRKLVAKQLTSPFTQQLRQRLGKGLSTWSHNVHIPKGSKIFIFILCRFRAFSADFYSAVVVQLRVVGVSLRMFSWTGKKKVR